MQESGEKNKKPNWSTVIALGLFLFALGFRLLGIGWGLKNDLHNASYHPDEPVVFGFSRAIQPELGQFVPAQGAHRLENFYSYGTLYLTLLRVASDMTSAYTGPPKVKGDGFSRNPELTDWDWVSRCHLAGRLISAFAGAGTAVTLFFLMRRRVGLIAGTASALVIAMAPGHLVQSRFQTVDILATFFLGLSLLYAAKIADFDPETPRRNGKPDSIWRIAALAGLFAGLSAGTKYTGILAVLSVLIAAIIYDRRKAFRLFGISAVVAAIAFVATTPGVVFDFSNFFADFQYEMLHTSTGHGLAFTGTPNGFIYTITNLFFGIGPLIVVLGLLGLIYGGYLKQSWAYVVLAFFIPYYIVIGRSEVKFLRYSFPLYVGIAAGFGYLVETSHRKGGVTRIGVGMGILGLGGVPFGGFATSVLMTRAMIDEDPRDQAARYLRSQTGRVGYANTPWFWSAPLFADSADPLFVPLSTKMALAGSRLAVIPTSNGVSVSGWDRDLVNRIAPDFVTYSSFECFPLFRLRGIKNLGQQQGEVDNGNGFLDDLARRYSQDRFYGNPILGGSYPDMLPEDLLYTNPVIYIWKKR